jgi:triacylglycerol lipase
VFTHLRPRAVAAFVALAIAATLGGAAGAGPAGASSPRPVLIVNGFNATDADLAGLKSYLQSQGFTVYTMNQLGSPPGSSAITSTANAVDSKIASIRAETGAPLVDIVGYSQGALAGRYDVKFLGGLGEVGVFVSLAGPNYGDDSARLCAWFWAGCRDMVPGSAFLNNLNAGDPTPGAIPYTHLYSNSEGGETIALPGATNVAVQDLCPGRALAHADEPDDHAMQQMIQAALEQRPITTTCPA